MIKMLRRARNSTPINATMELSKAFRWLVVKWSPVGRTSELKGIEMSTLGEVLQYLKSIIACLVVMVIKQEKSIDEQISGIPVVEDLLKKRFIRQSVCLHGVHYY